jgi:chromate reductase
MIELIGIAGSLRRNSFNRELLRAAADVMPDGTRLTILPIDEVPLYNGDLEQEHGIPAAVQALKDGIRQADGLVIATPEYNAGIPGVLKNVLDWISRPSSDIPLVLHGKPVALIGASPGRFGTALSQAAWLPVLRALRMPLWLSEGPFYVMGAGALFESYGLADMETRERLRKYMAAFAEHASGRSA